MRPASPTWIESGFWITLILVVTTNTVEAFTDVEGTWWIVLRMVIGGAFLVMLGAFVATKVAERRGGDAG